MSCACDAPQAQCCSCVQLQRIQLPELQPVSLLQPTVRQLHWSSRAAAICAAAVTKSTNLFQLVMLDSLCCKHLWSVQLDNLGRIEPCDVLS
jgi:hypothetical protein